MDAVFSRPLHWCTTTTPGRITLGIAVAIATIFAVGAILGLVFDGGWSINTTLLCVGAVTSLVSPLPMGIILGKKKSEPEEEISLHTVACQNDTAKIDRFLRRGGQINCRDTEGNTPLHQTARWGSVGGTNHLIIKGANLNAVNKEGQTPLHVAISCASPACVARRHQQDCWYQTVGMLIKAKADLDKKDRNGKTPLDLAKERRDKGFEILLTRTKT